MKKLVFALIVTMLTMSSCDLSSGEQQKSDSGVKKASIKLKTDVSGNTVEQKNIAKRYIRDNEIGEIKHLYIISSYTGDVLEYSTVFGKVTSGNKRLSPKTVNGDGYNHCTNSNWVQIDNKSYTTNEVLDDGGAYGESDNYLYWFDAQDNYHQYYPSGGTYLHISDRPLKVRKANFIFELEK